VSRVLEGIGYGCDETRNKCTGGLESDEEVEADGGSKAMEIQK